MDFVIAFDIASYMDTSPYGARLIEQVCARVNAHIPAYCRRSFDLETYRQWQEVAGATVFLPLPVNDLWDISRGSTPSLQVKCATAGVTQARVYVDSESLTATEIGGRSAKLTLADYDTLIDLASALASAIPGWSATILSEAKPLSLRPSGGDALGGVTFDGPGSPVLTKTIDKSAGIITLQYAIEGPIYVRYLSGYDSPPPELQAIAIEMAATLLRQSETDMSNTQERMGDYQVVGMDGFSVLKQFDRQLDSWRFIAL